MSKPFTIGIIGCGGIAQTHLKAYSELNDAQVAWVYDVDEQRATAFAEQAGAKVAPSLAWLATEAGIDAVSVCTPPAGRLEVCQPFLDAGVAILCEKPLARTVEEARALAEASRASDSLFLPAFCHRFHPAIIELKRLIDAGTLGRPLAFTSIFSGNVPVVGSHRADPALSGGGALIDNGTHSIDLLRHLFGEPTHVQAMTRPMPDAAVESLSTMQITTQDGGLAQLISGYCTPVCRARLEWVGDQGQAIVTYFDPSVPDLIYRRADDDAWTTVDCSGHPDRFASQARHFIDCVRQGKSPGVHVGDGVRVSEVVAAAYASAAGGAQPAHAAGN